MANTNVRLTAAEEVGTTDDVFRKVAWRLIPFMALWDALARSTGMPLATLLGSQPRALQAYDSRGLGLMEPDRLSKEADALLASGLKAVKLRLGYPSAKEDISALEAVRRVVGDAVAVMTRR